MDFKTYFKEYPSSEVVFQTKDGYLFHSENDAKNHARSLEDKAIVKHERNAASVKAKGDKEEVASEFEPTKPDGKKANKK